MAPRGCLAGCSRRNPAVAVLLCCSVVVAVMGGGGGAAADSGAATPDPLEPTGTTTAAPTLPPGSLRSYILLDLKRTVMTQAALDAAIDTFMASSGASMPFSKLFQQRPIIINTNGSLLTALGAVNEIVASPNTFPDIIFLAETSDVSTSVSDVLRGNEKTSQILLISVHTSNARLCDITTNPRTLCVVPRDMINLRGVLQVVSSELTWSSVAVVYSTTAYGLGVQASMSSQLAAARTAPTVVTEAFISPSGTPSDDDAIIMQIRQFRPVGVLCFVVDSELIRLRNAAIRCGFANSMVFLGSREAVNVVSQMDGSQRPLKPLWGMIFISQYLGPMPLIEAGYFAPRAVDEFGAYITCHLLDSMRVVMQAGSTHMKSLLSVSFSNGFTGEIAFDSITAQRRVAVFSLISSTFDMANPLLLWGYDSFLTSPVVTVDNPTLISLVIQSSPLLAVTVCMAAPATCADVESLNALAYLLMRQNQLNSNNANSVSYIPVPLNTGWNGVEGLTSLIPVSRSCTFLTGPGRNAIALALTPVVNEYKITQVDYNSGSAVFANELSYPYFSRTITEEAITYGAFADVCAYMSWQRVIIIVTNDQFGVSAQGAMSEAMTSRAILVERTYLLPDTSIASITSAFDSIYKNDVSRIIIPLLPLQGTKAQMFFDLVDTLPYLRQYILFLSRDLCQYSGTDPSSRNKLQSSICMYPYVARATITAFNADYNASGLKTSLRSLLIRGGFTAEASTCNLDTIRPYSAFAVDAGYTIISAVTRAVVDKVPLNSTARLLRYIRSSTISNFTPTFTIDAKGSRNYAPFDVDIQVPNATLSFGKWDARRVPSFEFTATTEIVWLTGSTEIPPDTFRSVSFILGTAASASPGTIVLSVFGFVGTVGVFVFCYLHYKRQRLIELTLENNRVPVTERQMRALEGKEINDEEYVRA